MIQVIPVSATQARVMFSGVKAHGVSYKGYYHAVLVKNQWQGTQHSEHKPFDFPLNSYTALTAHRDGTFIDATKAARKTLSEICLKAVIEHERVNGREFIRAEETRLQDAFARASDNAEEAAKAAKEANEAREAAFQALARFQRENKKHLVQEAV